MQDIQLLQNILEDDYNAIFERSQKLKLPFVIDNKSFMITVDKNFVSLQEMFLKHEIQIAYNKLNLRFPITRYNNKQEYILNGSKLLETIINLYNTKKICTQCNFQFAVSNKPLFKDVSESNHLKQEYQQLCKFCNWNNFIKKDINHNADDCSICLEKNDVTSFYSECTHAHHTKCLLNIITSVEQPSRLYTLKPVFTYKCPLCRKEIKVMINELGNLWKA